MTDATAIRLLNKVLAPLITVDCYNLSSPHDYALWRNELAAALDTLIQYHRLAGAVEAWEDALVALDADKSQKAKDGTIGITVLVHGLRATFERALAAAQARLAAYEGDR